MEPSGPRSSIYYRAPLATTTNTPRSTNSRKENELKTCYIEREENLLRSILSSPFRHISIHLPTPCQPSTHVLANPNMSNPDQATNYNLPSKEIFKRHNEEKYETMRWTNTKQEVQNDQNHALLRSKPRREPNPLGSEPVRRYRRLSSR